MFKSFPIVMHKPGPKQGLKSSRCQKIWDTVQRLLFKTKPKHHTLEDVTIITWNNTGRKGVLETTLDHLGVEYLVLGNQISKSKWENKLKINLTNIALSTINTKYVIGVDSFDVMVLENPNEIINRFLDFKCNILFNATVGSYPPIQELTDFENRTYKGDFFGHLNAGVWVGETKFCKQFFRRSSEIEFPPLKIKDIDGSEQKYIKFANMEFHPASQIDLKCKVFQIIKDECVDYISVPIKL